MAKATRPVNPAGEAVEEDVHSLADVVQTFGTKLEAIEGQPVVVTRVDFTTTEVESLDPERQTPHPTVSGATVGEMETKEVAIIFARPAGHPAVEPERFYTFSAPLIQRLREGVEKEAYPARATFVKKAFDGGRKQVWSIL